MEVGEMHVSLKFHATLTFHVGGHIGDKWLKWKGRKLAKGWTGRRSPTYFKQHAYITFTCTRAECYANMTPEIIENIKLMSQLLKEV